MREREKEIKNAMESFSVCVRKITQNEFFFFFFKEFNQNSRKKKSQYLLSFLIRTIIFLKEKLE